MKWMRGHFTPLDSWWLSMPNYQAGVVEVDGKWYVWPPEYIPWDSEDLKDIVRAQEPAYDSLKVAMAACRLLYGGAAV